MKKTVKAWAVRSDGKLRIRQNGSYAIFEGKFNCESNNLLSQLESIITCTVTYDDGEKGKRK